MAYNVTNKVYSSLNTLLLSINNKDYPLVDKIEYQNSKRTYIKYYNIPSSFDIETTSFYIGQTKCSVMYMWQFGINGVVCYGRTWEQFSEFIQKLTGLLDLGDKKRLIIYVHNLAFEFQFIKDLFEFTKIFARESRHPLYAITNIGIEFRCSYMLSGSSLEQTAKDCHKYICAKQVGLLDYDKIRTYKTFLTPDEIKYCVYDVICVMNYIQEMIDLYGSIIKIPLT